MLAAQLIIREKCIKIEREMISNPGNEKYRKRYVSVV